jgi:hypothetical protein
LPIRIGGILIAALLFAFGLLFGYMNFVIIIICNWFIDLSFRIKVVPGMTGSPEFLTHSWQFTRDFANIFFILIIAIIGLATILRLEKYEMKKTLPTLILMALLVNFSGVIVGVVVDISNIFTKSLLGMNQIANDSTAVWDWASRYIVEAGTTLFTQWDLSPLEILLMAGGVAFGGILLVVFYAMLAGVYLVVMLIFFMRIIALWILVIVSPLVFVMKILPATQKFWNDWWQQLIQWSIVGIPISFFILISNEISKSAGTLFGTLTIGANDANDYPHAGLESIAGAITSMLAPITAVVFLIVGLGISASFVPKGAQGITNFATKQGKKAGNWAKNRGKNAVSRGVNSVRERIPESITRGAKNLSSSKNPSWGKDASGANKGGLMAKLQRGAAAPLGASKRTLGGAITQQTGIADENIANKAGAEAKKRDVHGNLKALRGATSESEKREILAAMIDQKQMGDANDENIVGKGNKLTNAEVSGAYKNARKKGKGEVAEKLERSFVGNASLRTEFAKITDDITATNTDPDKHTIGGLTDKDRTEKGYKTLGEKIIGEAKSGEDIKQLGKGWHEKADLMEAVHKNWGGNQVGEATRGIGNSFAVRIQETAHDADWYYEIDKRTPQNPQGTNKARNAAMPRYLASSAAQGLGHTPLPGTEEKDELNNLAMSTRQSPAPNPSLDAATQTRIADNINLLIKNRDALNKKSVKTDAEYAEIKRLSEEISRQNKILRPPSP